VASVGTIIWTCRKLVVGFVRPENPLPQRKGVSRTDSLDLERHGTTLEICRRSLAFAARRLVSGNPVVRNQISEP
jgi:hypothetical protein